MNRSSAVIPAASRTKNMYLISVVAPISCHCFIYIPSIAVIPAAISLLLQMIEAQARYARASSGKSFQLVHCWLKVRHCEKFASLRQNKMPSRKQDAAPEGEEQQEASQGPPSKKARPPGRKQSKDKLKKNEGDDEYKDMMQNLMVMKAEEHKMKKERWDKDMALEQRRLQMEERRLQWEQEKKIMFCDMTTMDAHQRAYVLAKRAQIAKETSAAVVDSAGASVGDSGESVV